MDILKDSQKGSELLVNFRLFTTPWVVLRSSLRLCVRGRSGSVHLEQEGDPRVSKNPRYSTYTVYILTPGEVPPLVQNKYDTGVSGDVPCPRVDSDLTRTLSTPVEKSTLTNRVGVSASEHVCDRCLVPDSTGGHWRVFIRLRRDQVWVTSTPLFPFPSLPQMVTCESSLTMNASCSSCPALTDTCTVSLTVLRDTS